MRLYDPSALVCENFRCGVSNLAANAVDFEWPSQESLDQMPADVSLSDKLSFQLVKNHGMLSQQSFVPYPISSSLQFSEKEGKPRFHTKLVMIISTRYIELRSWTKIAARSTVSTLRKRSKMDPSTKSEKMKNLLEFMAFIRKTETETFSAASDS